MTRGAKKFLYGSFYLVFLGLVIYAVFSPISVEPPTGPEVLPLRAITAPEVFYLADGSSVVLGQIFNPNSGYGSPDFVYTLRFYGPAGQSLGEVTGRDFIYPLETKYVFRTSPAVPAGTAAKIEIVFSEISWQEADDFPQPNVSVQNVNTFLSPSRVEINGEVLNGSPFRLAEVRLTAVVFDGFGFPLFASETKISDLTSLSRRSFSVLFPSDPALIEKIDPGRTTVSAAAQ